MKFIVLILFLFSQQLIISQSIVLDSIDFNDELLFKKSIEYRPNGAIKMITYNSVTSDLKKVEFYFNQKQTKEQIWKTELLRETTFTYHEKDQIIKRFDVMNNQYLSPLIRIHLKYPALAAENGIEGEILVVFTFDKNCVPTDYKILNSLGHGIDEEVSKKAKLFIQLAQKYNVNDSNCTEIKEPLKFKFKL